MTSVFKTNSMRVRYLPIFRISCNSDTNIDLCCDVIALVVAQVIDEWERATPFMEWGGGGKVLLGILGRGVPLSSPNPEPMSDQNAIFHTRFQTWTGQFQTFPLAGKIQLE